MKILFLCSSLESGRDGVGDYTRRLADELRRQGHVTMLVALHDRHLMADQLMESQEAAGQPLESLRLSSRLTWKKRMELAENFIETLNPDWLSLQYVSFGFHDKGLPVGFGGRLRKLGKGRKWHVMFHELWVGMDTKSSVTHVAWGWAQRQLIKSLLSNLTPLLIHTQTSHYRHQLMKIGWKSKFLPLFGNIPVVIPTRGNIEEEKKNKQFVVFGSIHPGAPVKDFTQELALYSHRVSMPFKIVFVGRNGVEQKNWVDSCLQAGLQVQVLGEQSPVVLSETFRNSDFGIVTTPQLLVEKSGTLAAFREHQLPTLCVARPWFFRGTFTTDYPESVSVYQLGCLSLFLEKSHQKSESCGVTEVGRKFFNDLTSQTKPIWQLSATL